MDLSNDITTTHETQVDELIHKNKSNPSFKIVLKIYDSLQEILECNKIFDQEEAKLIKLNTEINDKYALILNYSQDIDFELKEINEILNDINNFFVF
jgi:hypothetical protein